MRRETLIVSLAVILLGGVGAGYLVGSSGAGGKTPTTVTPSFITTVITTRLSGPTLTMTVTQTTLDTTVVSIASTTLTRVSTVTTTPGIPWSNSMYLSDVSGCTINNVPSTCFTTNMSQAIIFGCTAQAATPQGCIQTVTISGSNTRVTITVWFPHFNQTFPWSNCYYVESDEGSYPFPAYCYSVTSAAFLVLEQEPPPL